MKNTKFTKLTFCLALSIFSLISCEDPLDGTTYTTTDELTIFQTLETYEQFSTYIDILEETGFDQALSSYGSYTCFVPTNDAIENYMSNKWGVTSIDELNEDQKDFLNTLVKFHTLPSYVESEEFLEGRLEDTTYTGEYLTSSFLAGGGIANVVINRDVDLGKYDIDASNGIIHELEGVLDPYVEPIPVLMELAGDHSIFVEAMKLTGYFDEFSRITDEEGNSIKYTILAETDEVYNENEIYSLSDLITRISPNDDDYLDQYNDLNRYVAYHATLNNKYLIDFGDNIFLSTVLENNAFVTTKTDKYLRLNEDTTAEEEDESWTNFVVADSNYPAKNGVYHSVDKIFEIYTPKAVPKLYDIISEQPEYDDSKGMTFYNEGQWSNLYWSPDVATRYLSGSNRLNHDNISLDVSGQIAVIEITTPPIPVGEYELMISGNGSGSARAAWQLYWDGEPIGSLWDLRISGNDIGFPDETAMMEEGFRLGRDDISNNTGALASENPGRMRFIISNNLVITKQQTHVLRLESVKAGNGPIDYIEYIPVSQ